MLAYGGMADEEQKEQIRSIGLEGGLDIAWLEEANRFTEDDFNEVLARLRGNAAPWRQVVLSTNPGAPTHWIKRRLIDQAEAHVYYSAAADNRYNPDDYRQMLERMTGVAYDRLVLGRWVQAEGAVYASWEPAKMVVDDDTLRGWGVVQGWSSVMPALNRKAIKRVICAVDWGYTNPGVLLVIAVDHDGRQYVVYQVIRTGKLIDWWVQRAVEIRNHFGVDAFICDPAEPAYILQFRQHKLYAIEADNDIEAGIQAVQRQMVIGEDGRPRLAVRRDGCAEPDPVLVAAKKPATLQDEIPGYQWPDSPDGRPVKEVPVKVDDHALDALRYGCFYLATLGAVRVPAPRQRSAIA